MRNLSAIALALALVGCVEVPERTDPADPADRGPTDGRAPDRLVPDTQPRDVEPPDRGLIDIDPLDVGGDDPDVRIADVGPVDGALPADEGPRPSPRCLPPREGVRADDDPCLELVPAAPMPTATAEAASGFVTTPDGPRLVVAGGYDPADDERRADPRTWLYDPIEDTWTAGPPMPGGGRWGMASAVDDGGALVIAGGAPILPPVDPWVSVASALRFDGDGWREVAAQIEPGRAYGALVAVGGDRTLLLGGRVNGDRTPADAADVISPGDIDNRGPALVSARARAAAVRLPDGRILLAGGVGADGQRVATPELGRPDGSGFEALDGLDGGHIDGAAVALSDGALLVGGRVGAGPVGTADAWRYDMRTQRLLPLRLHAPRLNPTATAIGPPGGEWRLVVGGDDGGIVDLYDPVIDRFRAYALPPPHDRLRTLHAAAAVDADGSIEVIVTGGQAGTELDPVAATDVLRLRLRPPPDDRPPPLPDGCLQIEGLANEAGPCLRVRRGPPLPAAAGEVGAAVATDGRIFMAGGVESALGGPFVSARSAVLEPGGRTWRGGPELTTARWGHLLSVAGGWGNIVAYVYGGGTTWIDGGAAFVATDTVEQWTEADNAWIVFGARLQDARVRGASAALNGHQDFVWVGGFANSGEAPVGTADFVGRGMTSPVSANLPRADGTLCAVGENPLLFGGHDGGALLAGDIQELDAPIGPWRLTGASIRPRSGAACVPAATTADILGGLDAIDGVPTDMWQRYEDGAPVRQLASMGRARGHATASAIGLGEGDTAAWLVVGGEATDDASPPAVELIYPRTGGGLLPQRYTIRLPEGVGLRRGHAAVTRHLFREARGTLVDRDVVVIGGFGPDDTPLDEVLIFTVDPFDPAALGNIGDPME